MYKRIVILRNFKVIYRNKPKYLEINKKKSWVM